MRRGIVAIQLENPRNSEQPWLLANQQIVTDAESIEIKRSDGQTLDVMSFAPRGYNKAAAFKQKSGHVESAYDARGNSPGGRSVKLSVAEQHDRDDPRKRNQPEEQTLEYFH